MRVWRRKNRRVCAATVRSYAAAGQRHAMNRGMRGVNGGHRRPNGTRDGRRQLFAQKLHPVCDGAKNGSGEVWRGHLRPRRTVA